MNGHQNERHPVSKKLMHHELTFASVTVAEYCDTLNSLSLSHSTILTCSGRQVTGHLINALIHGRLRYA